MKTLQRLPLILASTFALGLASCETGDMATNGTDVDEAEDLTIVTTFLPMTNFTKAVVGDRAEVEQLLPPESGAHHYQGTPGDVQMLANADVLVKNGLDIEFFLESTIESANNPDLTIIDTSQGISALTWDEVEAARELDSEDHDHDNGHSHDDNDHDHENSHDHDDEHSHDDNDHGHENSHDHDDEHSHDDNDHDHENGHDHDNGHSHDHDHGEYDPHIWLDPKRAMQQVENIRDRLIEVDPEGEDIYTENAAAYIEELEALDNEISETLSPYAGQTFVVFHDLANYFADSYGLRSEYLVGIPAENPSPDDVRRVMETVREYNIQAILTEPQAEQGFSSLAQDLDISVSVFDPIETGDSDSLEPEYYLTVMRQNAENLANTFEATEQSRLPLNMIPQQQIVSFSKKVESPPVIALGFQEK